MSRVTQTLLRTAHTILSKTYMLFSDKRNNNVKRGQIRKAEAIFLASRLDA